MGQAADPVDGRADLRLAGQVPPPEQGPREERPVVGIVHQAGHDPVDVSPASPLRCGRRIPLSRCSLNRPYGTVTERIGLSSCLFARVKSTLVLRRVSRSFWDKEESDMKSIKLLNGSDG